MSLKIVTIVGARPQFIKAAPLCTALRAAGHTEVLVHTGQHYEYGMSEIFFEEMGIPEPDVNLAVGSGSHGYQTGQMLMRLEELMLEHKPERVLVYGDTNSTLAGALAAIKLHLPVAHVEAGLRSFNRIMPEEHNRVLTDHCADWLFCPTQTAVDNLAREGITQGAYLVGDILYDAVRMFSERAAQRATILDTLAIHPRAYYLATVHRPHNTDFPENLTGIWDAFQQLDKPVIFPAHPRTRLKIADLFPGIGDGQAGNVRLIAPVGYLDMLTLEKNAALILTDSGGMQKEAFFAGVPCITLRPETEWIETVDTGWNVLAGADPARILAAAQRAWPPTAPPAIFGDGHTAQAIVEILAQV